MTPRDFALLAAVVFAIMALLQLIRAVSGWPIVLGTTVIPLWLSWIAFLVLGGLSVLGFTSRRHR
jgi:hypothetical protein